MDRREMEQRTKALALRILRLCRELRRVRDDERRIIANQLLRSGTSVGANYRAAGRARSKAEFLSKLGNVEEEADETCFWLELIIEGGVLGAERVRPLLVEADEVLRIVAASRKRGKENP